MIPRDLLVLDCRENPMPGSEGSGDLLLEEAVRVRQHVLLDVLHVEHLLRQLLGLRLLSALLQHCRRRFQSNELTYLRSVSAARHHVES